MYFHSQSSSMVRTDINHLRGFREDPGGEVGGLGGAGGKGSKKGLRVCDGVGSSGGGWGLERGWGLKGGLASQRGSGSLVFLSSSGLGGG